MNTTPTFYPEQTRQALFAELVRLQDTGLSVLLSRVSLCRRFGVTVEEVRALEVEGRAKNWEPLPKREGKTS